MTAADIVGVVLWGIGMFFETTADFQKFYFKGKAENRGKWCTLGRYTWSFLIIKNFLREQLFGP